MTAQYAFQKLTSASMYINWMYEPDDEAYILLAKSSMSMIIESDINVMDDLGEFYASIYGDKWRYISNLEAK